MSYCLNPNCQNPQNSVEETICQSCQSKLLLMDRYRSLKPIGSGGFGRTFLAIDEHRPSKPYCVIKQFYYPNSGNLQKAIALFKEEARRIDQLGSHPQIPELYAQCEQEKLHYLVQEYIKGSSLALELSNRGSFNESEIREILQNLLPVLSFIHNQGIIHRDLKPSNIIRQEGNQTLVLVDFGSSKIINNTITGTIIGSPGYSAPEQTVGKAIFASDLYSLGVICIHLLTQIDPFELYSYGEGKWVWKDYLLNPISAQLEEILNKMLQFPLNKRYQSANDILLDLNQSSSIMVSHPNQRTLIVGKLGNTDYRTIKAALQEAQAGDQIIVRPGFYEESLVIDKPIELIGEGNNSDIIIQATFQPTLKIRTSQAIIKNLTIRRTSLNDKFHQGIFQVINKFWKLAAIEITKQVILENCQIDYGGGSGIIIWGKESNPQIIKCQILGKQSYGILIMQNATGLIDNCQIRNYQIGIGIFQLANPTIRQCQISGMIQDGVIISDQGQGLIEHCQITQNRKVGVRIQKLGNPTITYCQITQNQQQGIYISSNGAGPIENCDLSNNLAPWYIAPKCAVRRYNNFPF